MKTIIILIGSLLAFNASASTVRIYGETAKEIYYKLKDVSAVRYGSTSQKNGLNITCNKSAYIYDCIMEINPNGEILRR
jgi:hypothetical protein